MPPSSPIATDRAIALQANATSKINELKSPLDPGKRRRSSIKYWVRVVRFLSGIGLSLYIYSD